MMVDVSSLKEIILPVSMVFGGFLLGVVLETIIRRVIRRVIHETKWELDKHIGHALHRTLIFICTLLGIYGAIHTMTLDREIVAGAHQILLVLMILVVTVIMMRFSADLVDLYSRRVGGVFVSTSIFANLTRFVVFLIGLLMALQSLGISIAPILTALGVGGLAVALALQDTLSNLFSGIHVIASKQVRPGDYIKLSTGEEGYVTDIAWRYATMKGNANNMIIVPNSKLASAIVTNYNYPEKEMFVTVPVVVSYDNDLEKIEKLAVEVATVVMEETPGGVHSFSPFIRFQKLGQFGISLNVVFKVAEFNDQFVLKHEFIRRFYRLAREEGVEFISGPRNAPV
jgi:small-conductance mechanosensitive channel